MTVTATVGSVDRRSFVATNSPVAAAARPALLLLAGVLALVAWAGPATLGPLCLVLVLALVGRLVHVGHRTAVALLLSEVFVAVGGIVLFGGSVDPLLISLSASVLAVGLAGGYARAALTTGAAAIWLATAASVDVWAPTAGEPSRAGQWLAVSLVFGLLGARIRSLSGANAGEQDRYVEAHRLLAQLTTVSRRLPGSLDPGTVAHTLMDECVATADCQYGAVFLQVGGDQLVPLALHGYQRVPWRASLAEGGPIQRAWLAGTMVVDRRQSDPDGNRRGSTLVVVPMTVAEQRVGVVALEWRRAGEPSSATMLRLAALVEQHALPLRTATLFDELRMSAAAEERSRLAREMHDGIAQDLAHLGYEVDALLRALRQPSTAQAVDQAHALRSRINELIGELRLSITDLRSSVGPGRGLGAALSQYARSVGTSTGMTVHLSLTEGSTRLSSDAEVQFLRIAHEAITRARRRPGTRNLWVTLVTDPPAAQLVIEDDGRRDGASAVEQRHEEVVDDRVTRLGAMLMTTPRAPTGTRVSIALTGVVDREDDRVAR